MTCWGTGNPLREFLHVDDLGDAVVFALENWDPSSSKAPKDENNNKLTMLNVGTGKDISIKELAYKISQLVNYQGKIIWDSNKPDGTPKKLLNIQQIKSLGWEPKYLLEKELKQRLILIKLKNF